jgi:DNA-binding MarR family transcriptional regulator
MADKKLVDFISKLGVDPEAARVYLGLAGAGALTAQEIAKHTGIPKTTVYRRTEELISLGIVEEQIDEYKKRYLATNPNLLGLLVTKKEEEAKQLRSQLPEVANILLGQLQGHDPETKVLFYRGKDGIQQMVWNTLRSKTDLVGYTYRVLNSVVGSDFAEKWNGEFSFLKIKARDLYSDEFIKSKKDPRLSEPGDWKAWESRYLPPEILDVRHQMDIYNDVVAIYNWHEGEVFGVEIYNQKVADMQRQIFEVLWKLGKPPRR